MSTSIEEFAWLTGSSAANHLIETQHRLQERDNVVRIAKSLRKQLSAVRSALVLEQAQLRIRARRKFEHANQMFFTKRGLQQSTGSRIAEYKARRFVTFGRVADICCSIGGDLLELGRVVHRVSGVDKDPVAVLYARKNAEVLGLNHIDVQEVDFESFAIHEYEAIHIDPDRRGNNRTVQGDFFQPPLPAVVDRIGEHVFATIKTAPATPRHSCLPETAAFEWIGNRRECKQQLVHLNHELPVTEQYKATRVVDGGKCYHFSAEKKEVEQLAEIASKIDSHIYEPHSSILAGRMTDALAIRYGLSRLASDIVYLTGDGSANDKMMRRFRVDAVLPLDLRKVSDYLREHSIGSLEVKNRGVMKFVVEKFEKLKTSGENRAVLFLTRHVANQVAIIAGRA